MSGLRLVVNADDLGLSPGVDAAVFEGLEAGWLGSTTVLANGPSSGEALPRVRGFPRASVGVHLNLTEFPPLTRGLGHLLGPDGAMSARSLHVRPEDRDAVAAEWIAQITRVRQAGIEVTHLDSHQHLHHLPVLWPVLREVRARSGIARVRGMGALRPLGRGIRATVGALRQRVRAARFVGRLRRDGAVTTDGFASVAVFLAHAGALPAGWRTVELMAHPGNPHSPTYAEEVARLREGALRRWTLVSWREIG